MSRFTPIDPAMTLKKPVTFRGEKYRDVGHHTQEYLYTMDQIDDPGYFANSWGYTIFRTDYSTPSESFARAVKLLTTYAGNWLFDDLNTKWRPFDGPPIDPRAMYEVRSRLYNAVVEDQATLENAPIEEVGRQFDLWITRNRDEDEADGPPSARFLYCIMLDKESIENLLALPDQPNQVQAPDIWYVWVKVITNEVRDGRRLWLRVGVYDVLWEHWFTVVDPEIQFEEMIGDYDEEGGVCNLYGPPTGVPKPGDPIPMDTRPGHPTRRLASIPYPRLTPP